MPHARHQCKNLSGTRCACGCANRGQAGRPQLAPALGLGKARVELPLRARPNRPPGQGPATNQLGCILSLHLGRLVPLLRSLGHSTSTAASFPFPSLGLHAGCTVRPRAGCANRPQQATLQAVSQAVHGPHAGRAWAAPPGPRAGQTRPPTRFRWALWTGPLSYFVLFFFLHGLGDISSWAEIN